MRVQVKAFQAAAIHSCRLRRFSFTEFMEDWGLEEVLADAEKNNTPPTEMAARFLADYCISDGKFNNFQVGLLTVMKFLNDTRGPLGQGQQQSLIDLVGIRNTGGSYHAIMGWMNTHYP